MIFIGGLFSALGGSLGSNITKSNEKREKMDTSNTTYSNTWFVDELGWLGRGSKLRDGLESFYKKTMILTIMIICMQKQKLFMKSCSVQMKDISFSCTLRARMIIRH